jgi:hypothetical protein
MSSGSCLTSKLYDKFIKMQSKSHETISLRFLNLSVETAVNSIETAVNS